MLGHDGGDEEGIGDVVEAFAASTFLGEKVGGEGFGDAEEVAEGGGVFGAIEAAEAAFAGVLDFAAAEEGLVFGDPVEEDFLLVGGGLVFFGRRHLAGEELIFGAPPEAEGGAGVGEVLEGGEVDAAFGGIGAVAIGAEGLQDGPDFAVPGGLSGAGVGGGGEAQQGEAEEEANSGGHRWDYVWGGGHVPGNRGGGRWTRKALSGGVGLCGSRESYAYCASLITASPLVSRVGGRVSSGAGFGVYVVAVAGGGAGHDHAALGAGERHGVGLGDQGVAV